MKKPKPKRWLVILDVKDVPLRDEDYFSKKDIAKRLRGKPELEWEGISIEKIEVFRIIDGEK